MISEINRPTGLQKSSECLTNLFGLSDPLTLSESNLYNRNPLPPMPKATIQ